jgi:hypothetical protein
MLAGFVKPFRACQSRFRFQIIRKTGIYTTENIIALYHAAQDYGAWVTQKA